MFGKGLRLTIVFWAMLACIALIVWGWPRYLFLQSDTFWLIETGRYILDHQRLPVTDVYSFTRFGSPWFVYQWLFELLLAALFQFGGWLGVSLLAVVVLVCLFFVLMVRGMLKEGSNAPAAFLVACCASVALMPDLVSIRPQLLTFLLLWLVRQILEKFRSDPQAQPWKQLFWLPVIMLVWVNVHISFVIELLVLAVYTACACLPERAGEQAGGTRKLWQPLAVVSLVCLAVSLLNPHGWNIYTFLYQSWQEHILTPELREIDWGGQPALLLFVVGAVVAIFASIRTVSAPVSVLSGIFLVCGLSAARFIEYFVIWTVPVLACWLTRLSARLTREGPLKTGDELLRTIFDSKLYVAQVLMLSVAVAAASPTFFPSTIPVSAAEYLANHRLDGKLFCGEHAGSYLIYRFRGAVPVFIDTRVDVYGAPFCGRFSRATMYGEGWQELFDEYRIGHALVMNRYRLAELIGQSAQWRVVYKDSSYTIFQRGIPAFEPESK